MPRTRPCATAPALSLPTCFGSCLPTSTLRCGCNKGASSTAGRFSWARSRDWCCLCALARPLSTHSSTAWHLDLPDSDHFDLTSVSNAPPVLGTQTRLKRLCFRGYGGARARREETSLLPIVVTGACECSFAHFAQIRQGRCTAVFANTDRHSMFVDAVVWSARHASCPSSRQCLSFSRTYLGLRTVTRTSTSLRTCARQ